MDGWFSICLCHTIEMVHPKWDYMTHNDATYKYKYRLQAVDIQVPETEQKHIIKAPCTTHFPSGSMPCPWQCKSIIFKESFHYFGVPTESQIFSSTE